MNEINVKKIMEMASYGRPVQEEGDYSIDYSPVATGRDHNQTNQMGDNPLPLEEEAGEVTEVMIDQLYEILHNAGKSDSDIAMGNVKIKPTSAEKVMRTIAPGQSFQDPHAFLEKVLAALAKQLDPSKEQVVEFQEVPNGARFVHNIDTMGNVQIVDSQSGKEVVLSGEDSMELIGELEMNGGTPEQVQEILASYQHVLEGDMGQEVVSEDMNLATSGVRSLLDDIKNMENKLKQMLDKAEADGDVMAATAANIFSEEVTKLETAIDDYLKQQS
jgi:DNA-binding ferritin-like protein